jgi:hypothetical protein
MECWSNGKPDAPTLQHPASPCPLLVVLVQTPGAHPATIYMSASYCYWSVATGAYGALMERCARTARRAGVFKQFHVLTDRPLADCECYDACQCGKADGMFKLHYLKVGMSRLPFEYFIWVDADTVFVRNPVDALAPLGRSPIHVPLEANLTALAVDCAWRGLPGSRLRGLYRDAGVANQAYLSQSAFWIVHREAIEAVYDLAFQFWNRARGEGIPPHVDFALGFAMQMLCANPEAHLVTAHPHVWASDDAGLLPGGGPGPGEWEWRHPLCSAGTMVRPAIVHLPSSKPRGG